MDTKELRALIRTERPRYGQLQDFVLGLLERLDAAEAEPLPSPYPEGHLARGMGLAMDIGKQDGRKFALRNEVAELAKALGLPATS